MSVTLANHDPEAIAAFRELVQSLDAIRECHAVMGEADFMLKAVTTDLDAFKQLAASLEADSNVVCVKTLPVSQTIKDEPGLPLQQ